MSAEEWGNRDFSREGWWVGGAPNKYLSDGHLGWCAISATSGSSQWASVLGPLSLSLPPLLGSHHTHTLTQLARSLAPVQCTHPPPPNSGG